MHGQAWGMKGTTFKINHILYVDDGMFMLETKSDMIKRHRDLEEANAALWSHHAHWKRQKEI
jgi:hypothetical protein